MLIAYKQTKVVCLNYLLINSTDPFSLILHIDFFMKKGDKLLYIAIH
jgi:hypothetical protein